MHFVENYNCKGYPYFKDNYIIIKQIFIIKPPQIIQEASAPVCLRVATALIYYMENNIWNV